MPPRSEPQEALGRAIRDLRNRRGLSQMDLAHAADVHPTWVSHLESGRSNPAWGTVSRIARGLGVAVSELASLAEEIEGRDDRR